ncbi:MAG: DUF445 domain-containing protein [Pseudomonadota bacterium]
MTAPAKRPQPDLTAIDVEKEARLKRTRRLAGGTLAGFVGIWLGTHVPDDPPEWVHLIRHMAEAGMIGGLADWFAVTALFRHPLGIKIPHTALLPRNQKRAADSVGAFFKSYFLEPEAVTARVAEIAPAKRAAEWLQEEQNAKLVAGPLTRAVAIALKKDGESQGLNAGLRREIRTAIESRDATKALSKAVGPVLDRAVHGPLLDDMLEQISNSLDDNRDRVLEIVQNQSRWWVATQIDRGLSTVLVEGVLRVIDDLQKPDSRLRKRFERGLEGFVKNLQDKGTLDAAIHDGKASFAQSDAFNETIDSTLALIRDRFSDGLSEDPSEAEAAIAGAIQGFARKLLSDPETLARFEGQLSQTVQTAITELRDPIGDYVTSVIESWESQELSDRFEREIGPDLQFIRINGAVLGALIGGVLFFAGKALTAL